MENQTASKNIPICSQAGSKSNAALCSQSSQGEKSIIHCNPEQPLKTPNQIDNQQQENVLSEEALNELMEFTKEAYQANKNVDMDQNSSLRNINIMTNKEVSTNCYVDKTQTLNRTFNQKVLLCRKQNSWVHNKPGVLYSLLHSILDTLLKQPDAGPFLQPVDAHKVKDYYDIVKNPMDLSTIRSKLTSGQYQSGWEFIDDMWLMFNNAWLYNKKCSRVYKNCTQLSELFSSLIDNPMRRLGHCCGQHHIFEPSYIFCCGRQNCIIPKFAAYWNYDRCYSEFRDEVIFGSAEGTISVSKEKFIARVNDITKKEIFVECLICKIKCHKICVLHVEDIWKEGFICNICLKYSLTIKTPNKFTSESLPQTKLGFHIENRVNCFLESNGCNSRIIVRIVYQAQKAVHVKLGAENRFVKTGIWPDHFPYTSKTLLAFQRYENRDVCFFAMFVQEYNSECPYPNTRRAYISYLDSVHFFTPKDLKTAVYHEIFLGYLEYINKLGFTTAHLWSCPSKKGEDYVFHCHPKSQRNPSIKQLLLWYRKMLDKGIKEHIVKCYKDIYRYAVDSKLKHAFELPYFEGDFWPNVLENEISKLDGNTASNVYVTMEKGEFSPFTDLEDKAGNDLNEETRVAKCRKNKKKIKKTSRNSNLYLTGDPLMDKLFVHLYKFKEVFLVIEMENISNLPAVVNQDPLIPSDLMCSREIFLEFCRENFYEFSSLRRARYSTMVFLYELHKEKIATFSCNQCKKIIEERMHCSICKDFDLCSDCYILCGHDHEMETVKAKPSPKSYYSFIENINSPFFLQSLQFIDQHLCLCNNANCFNALCKRIKNQILHLNNCKYRKKHCPHCFYILHLLIRHAKRCKITNCLICKKIKASVLACNQKVENTNSNTASASNEMCNNMSISNDSYSNRSTINRNAGSSFTLDDEQLKERNIAEKDKTLSSINMFATTDITETNRNLQNTNVRTEISFPKSTTSNCEINGLFSSYSIKSDFPKNSFSSTLSDQTLHNMPFNECQSESVYVIKNEDDNVNSKTGSTNTHNSLLLSNLSSSDDLSSSVLKCESIKNSAYLPSQNVTSSETCNPEIPVLKGYVLEKKASDLPQVLNSVKTDNYLIHQVKTDVWSDAQILNSNIDNNFRNSFMGDLPKSNSKPVDLEQKSLPALLGSPISVSLDKFNMPTSREEKLLYELGKTPLMTIDLNSFASKTDIMPCVPDADPVHHNINVIHQNKQENLPEAFSYETDKNSVMYLGTQSHLQNSYSATKQESSEFSPSKSNSFPVVVSNKYEDVKNIMPDNTSSGNNTSLTCDLETCRSQFYLDTTKNIKHVFKIPKTFLYSLPTHTKVGEKGETLINNSSVEKFAMKTEFNKSNSDCQADGSRQITSKVLYNKQCKTINLPTLLRRRKVSNNRNSSNNVYLTASVQNSTVCDSITAPGNTSISNAFQEVSSSDNHASSEIFQPKYINANNDHLKLTNNGEYGKFVYNADDYPSSHNLLIPSSCSNVNNPSAVTSHRFRNFSCSDGEKCNHVLPHLNFFNDAKNLTGESEKTFDQSFNSNLITSSLTRKYVEDSSNAFTEITDAVTACYKVAISSNNSSNQEVSVSTDSSKIFDNRHLMQTSLSTNFPTKYLLIDSTSVPGNSEISNSNDPKMSDNITYTNLDQTGSNSLQTLNFSVSEQSSLNIPKITSCESSAIGKQVQFAKISFNKLSTASVDATTASKSYNKPNDFLVNCQDFQSSNHTGSISLLPLNNIHQIKSSQVMNDANFSVLSMESSNQVLNQRGSRMNDKLNTNSLYSTECNLDLKQGTVQKDRRKKMLNASNIHYLQPALKVNQTDTSKKEIISFSKNSSTFQPRKLSTLQQHNYESFVTSDRIGLMYNDQNNPNFGSVGSISENVRNKKPLVMKISSSDSSENNFAQESNIAELTFTSIPLVKDNTDFISTSQNKNVDSRKSYQNLYCKIPMNKSNEESSIMDLNTMAEPAVNVSNNSKFPSVTVMYVQSAHKMNAKDSTQNYTSNNFKTVHASPASVNQDTSILNSSKRLLPRSSIIKQSQSRFLNKKHSPNIIKKKCSLLSSSSEGYHTLNPSVYINHSENVSCDIKNNLFDSTSITKNNGSSNFLISSKIVSGCSEQFENQEFKFALNHPPETINSKNVEPIACNNPAFSSDQCIYSVINNNHFGNSSTTQNSLSTRNFEYHFSNSSLSKELYNVDNISNYNIDSQVQNMQKSPNSAQKTSACSVYVMRSVKKPKEINRRVSQKRPLKKCKYDMEYIHNNK